MEEMIKETTQNVLVEGIVEETVEDILKGATQSKSKSVRRVADKAGVFSIVNAKTGTRLTFANTVLEKLGNPKEIQVSYDRDKKIIIVGEQLLGNENSYTIRQSGKKGIVYAKNLVEEITEAMQLNFSNRTSITFQGVEYPNDDQYLVAIIKIK